MTTLPNATRCCRCPGFENGCDVLIIDEAQDVSACFASVLERQVRCAKILVGDPQQQIYSFAGAVNAMANLRNLSLSQQLQQQGRAAQCLSQQPAAESWTNGTPSSAGISSSEALAVDTPAQDRPRPMGIYEKKLSVSFRFSRPIAIVANSLLRFFGPQV